MSQHSGTASAPAEGKTTPEKGLDAHAILRQLAHELRQPLSTIESIAYYLDIVVPRQDTRVRQQVERLRQVAQHASWIVSDAIQYVQTAPVSPQILDLNELIADAIREAIGGGQAWLETRFGEPSPLVRIDVDQGRHMMRNVLLLFGRLAGAKVYLSTEQSESAVVLAIAAEGMDFNSEELAPLLGSLTCDGSEGFGLGLAGIRRIVERHGGRIELNVAPDSHLSLRMVFPPAA